jgi:RNA polymerase sigma factor (sigma-70 family)
MTEGGVEALAEAREDAAGATARAVIARSRLAAELAHLPAWGAAAFWMRLRSSDPAGSVSSGALVALLRHAVRLADRAAAEELFVLLLRRIEGGNARWAFLSAMRAPVDRASQLELREDLEQDLVLHLWRQLALGGDEAWELYFSSALNFARRHVATAWMERHGYWTGASAASPTRVPARLLSRLAPLDERDEAAPALEPVDPREPLTVADLADLRDEVARLPGSERVAVVMRFWLGVSERDIAAALGVTSRTVRNLLARAYRRLREAYGEVQTYE